MRVRLANEASKAERDASFGCTVENKIRKLGLTLTPVPHPDFIIYQVSGPGGVPVYNGENVVVYADHGATDGPHDHKGAQGATDIVTALTGTPIHPVNCIQFWVCELTPWVDRQKTILKGLNPNNPLEVDSCNKKLGAMTIDNLQLEWKNLSRRSKALDVQTIL